MTRLLRTSMCSLAVAVLAACGSTDPDVVDFSGDWIVNWQFTAANGMFCEMSGISLTVSQRGANLSGTSTGGTESCMLNNESWPPDDIGNFSWSGTATETGVSLTAIAGPNRVDHVGNPTPEGFAGTITGDAELDPFNTGSTTATGTWTARR